MIVNGWLSAGLSTLKSWLSTVNCKKILVLFWLKCPFNFTFFEFFSEFIAFFELFWVNLLFWVLFWEMVLVLFWVKCPFNFTFFSSFLSSLLFWVLFWVNLLFWVLFWASLLFWVLFWALLLFLVLFWVLFWDFRSSGIYMYVDVRRDDYIRDICSPGSYSLK